jgi:MFS family permease
VSATGLGIVFAASVVPQVGLLAVAGAIADRLGRRRVMLAADTLRCAAQGSLAAAMFAGRPALWVFVLLAWLEGIGEAFFTPALDALTVEIAPRDQLGNVNALYGLAASSTRIAGPALGGLFVALAGPGVVVAAGAAVSGTFAGTAMQQQVPPDKLARVSSLILFPSYGIGVIGYVIDGRWLPPSDRPRSSAWAPSTAC